IRFLPISLVIAIHDDQVRLYGGSYGLRDQGVLEAALAMPQTQFGGQFLHGTIFHMAAAYGFHLCQNHPFIDGNKRVAGMTMFTFLQLNGLKPIASEIDYYNTIMAVASGQLSKEQLTNWLPAVVEGTPPEVET
ncbi:MAG: type II toxin-antitoxin system death-on-curing family toxin, partial [Ktedonobacteraceae bacterium]|nr:type II toxin-antitoxin system death-on-curing family toxin [Ktedonobacteraceae bacterium]